jgi:hypothetical protein
MNSQFGAGWIGFGHAFAQEGNNCVELFFLIAVFVVVVVIVIEFDFRR